MISPTRTRVVWPTPPFPQTHTNTFTLPYHSPLQDVSWTVSERGMEAARGKKHEEAEGDVFWWLVAVGLNHSLGRGPTSSPPHEARAELKPACQSRAEQSRVFSLACWETAGGRHTLNLSGVWRGPLHSSYKQMELCLMNAYVQYMQSSLEVRETRE